MVYVTFLTPQNMGSLFSSVQPHRRISAVLTSFLLYEITANLFVLHGYVSVPFPDVFFKTWNSLNMKYIKKTHLIALTVQ